MGNKQSRELTRPKARGRPCTCDIFKLDIACHESELIISLVTDLPAKTRVAVAARRWFVEANFHKWEWTCLEKSVSVAALENNLTGFLIRVGNDELDTKGHHMYRHLKKAMGVVIASPPSREMEVVVSAPTTDHRFGLCNRLLTGNAVTVNINGHSLEQSVRIAVPLSEMVGRRLGV